MYYELWDVEVGNGIARYEDDREMASLVRVLIDAYGDAYAQDLDLTIENEVGTVLQSLSGRELVAWVGEELTDRDSRANGSQSAFASRRKSDRSRNQGLAANPALRHASSRDQGSSLRKKD